MEIIGDLHCSQVALNMVLFLRFVIIELFPLVIVYSFGKWNRPLLMVFKLVKKISL